MGIKYGAETFKGITPRVRGKQPARKIARKQERREGKAQATER